MAQPARMQDDVSGPEPLRSRAPACDRAGRSDGSPRAPRQSTRARRGSDRGRRRMDTDRPTPGRGASSPASCERPPRRPPSRSPWQTLQRPDRVRRGRARHDGTADGTTARRMHAGRVPAAASTPRRKRAGHQMVTESRFRSFSQAKARRPGGRFAARMPVNAGRARLTELGVIGLKSPATNLPSPAPGERVSGREKQARNPGRCEPAGQNSSRPNPTSAGGSTARYSRPRRPPGRNLRALRPEDAAHRRRTGLCRSRLSPAGRLSERTAGTSKSLPPPRYDGFNVRDQTAQRSQRLSDIAVAPRPRQPDVADAERVAQVEQRHLNRSAATSTPAEHVLDLSVGFRPLPQTTRSRVSCRAPGRRHPAGAGTARASGPSRTIRPGRAGTFKMYQDRLPVGRSWCARCGAHQADKLALDNTPVCARCWLPTDEQAANSPPTSSEGINLRLPTAAHLRRGKP